MENNFPAHLLSTGMAIFSSAHKSNFFFFFKTLFLLFFAFPPGNDVLAQAGPCLTEASFDVSRMIIWRISLLGQRRSKGNFLPSLSHTLAQPPQLSEAVWVSLLPPVPPLPAVLPPQVTGTFLSLLSFSLPMPITSFKLLSPLLFFIFFFYSKLKKAGSTGIPIIYM